MSDKTEPKPYLCGGINGLTDDEAKNWRELVKKHFPASIDPMRRDYRGQELYNASAIVEGDLQDLCECDVIIANCMRPSWGTAMEIFYAAHVLGKPVIAVVPDYKMASPWLRHHSVMVENLDAAIDIVDIMFRDPRETEL